jgi:hypothetical protein
MLVGLQAFGSIIHWTLNPNLPAGLASSGDARRGVMQPIVLLVHTNVFEATTRHHNASAHVPMQRVLLLLLALIACGWAQQLQPPAQNSTRSCPGTSSGVCNRTCQLHVCQQLVTIFNRTQGGGRQGDTGKCSKEKPKVYCSKAFRNRTRRLQLCASVN